MADTSKQSTSSSGVAFLALAILVPAVIIILGVVVALLVNETLGIHMASGAFFLLLTIGFLDRMIAAREKQRREPLRKGVINEIGKTLYAISNFLRELIDGPFWPLESRDEFYTALRELAERKDIKLSENSQKFSPQRQGVPYQHRLHENIFDAGEELRELGTRYPDILEPSLRACLLRIRYGIKDMQSTYRLMNDAKSYLPDLDPKAYAALETEMSKAYARESQSIVKEIYSIHKMNIPLYRSWMGQE